MPRASLRTLLIVDALLALGAAIYAESRHLSLAVVVPVVAAFLLQISFYLALGFPEMRSWLAHRFSPARLAAIAVVWAIAPYLIYSLPAGVFQFSALAKLGGLAGTLGFVFVIFPVKGARLTWPDVAAAGTIALALLSRVLRQVYRSPIPGLRLESMGHVMIIGLGAMAFLCLRQVEGTGFRFQTSREEWKTGIKQLLLFLIPGAPLALLTGAAHFHPLRTELWLYPLQAAGTFLGMYAVVALSEELFFRGVLQNLSAANLGGAIAAQAAASIIFGLCHLPFRGFPNWRFAALAALLGWFCGQAYREARSVVASSLTHALAISAWRLLFSA